MGGQESKIKTVIIILNQTKVLGAMIYKSSQYFSRKQKIRSFKNSVKNQIVKLAVFAIICVVVGSLVVKSSAQNTYTIYYAQTKIVNKHSRGVFPPLQGHFYNLHGCWEISAKIGKKRIDTTIFKNYTLCFQQSGRMMIKKKGPDCQNPSTYKIYHWKAFSHNLFISEQKITKLPQDNILNDEPGSHSSPRNEPQMKTDSGKQGENKDKNNADSAALKIQCLSQNEPVLEYVRSFTVWTIRENNVYLISQTITGGIVEVSIIVLNRKY